MTHPADLASWAHRQQPLQDHRQIPLHVTAQSSALIVNVNIGSPRPADFTTLAPGASVEKEYELRTYYQLGEPGDYTLRGTYHNKWSGEEIIGQTAWTGQVESAPITVHIDAAGQESTSP